MRAKPFIPLGQVDAESVARQGRHRMKTSQPKAVNDSNE